MILRILALITFCFSPLFGNQDREQVVILGSGAAGLTAAIYASRAGLTTLVIEGEEPGGQIALSYTVDNFPGFANGINGYDLIQNMREQAMRFGTKVQTGKVVEIDLKHRPFTIKLEDDEVILAETLIIASGASTKWLGLKSEKALIGKGVCSCAVCDGILFEGQEAVVVGGGDTALEDALFLANYATKVTIINRTDRLKASKYLQDKALANERIHFIWNSVVEEIADPLQGEVKGVFVKNLDSQKTQYLPCQGVFIAIGHTPNSHLFKGQLELDAAGYIMTHQPSTRTSVPGVFAAGDIADPHYRQAITAAGTGCRAGIDAYHFIQKSN